jgi:hypothetical protein
VNPSALLWNAAPVGPVTTISATQVPPAERPEWLWRPYLARGTLTVLDGDPGVGKSLVALDLMARLTAGRAWPGEKAAADRAPEACLVANAEDPLADVLLPRFDAAGGARDRLDLFGGLHPGSAGPVQFPRDFPALAARLRAAPCGLCVLDPMMALFPPEVTANSDQVIRSVLAPFAHLAAETGTAVLFVRHLTKRGGRKSVYRGTGSIGILGAVRTGLLAGRHPEEPGRFVLAVTKTNLAKETPGLGYRIEDAGGVPVVRWLKATAVAADDLCGSFAADPAGKGPENWLRELLAAGPVPAAEVERKAAKAGIDFRALKDLKRRLKIESRRIQPPGGKARWEWWTRVHSLHRDPLGPLV